jgi:hypothetical protein
VGYRVLQCLRSASLEYSGLQIAIEGYSVLQWATVGYSGLKCAKAG